MSAFSSNSQKATLLSSLDLFKILDSRAIQSLAVNCEEIILNPEEILFNAGEFGDAMFVILFGDLSIEKHKTVIAKRVRGDYVGEIALIESVPRTATVRALTKTYLLKISKEQFHIHFTSNPEVMMEIMKTFSERSRENLKFLDRSMEKLQTQKKITSQLQNILNDTLNEIYSFNPTTFHFIQMNPRALSNLKYKSEEISKLKPLDIIGDIAPKEFEEWVALLRSKKKEEIKFSGIQRRKDGSFYPVKTQLKLDYTESPPVIVGIVQDISELREIENKYKQLTLFDPLTGLPNRNQIIYRLPSVILEARNANQSISVFLIDWQNFKTISNSMGHLAGDLLFIAVAKRLKEESSLYTLVGRWGENEFITVLSHPNNQTQVEEAARFLLNSFKTPFSINGQDIFVDLGIGISSYPTNGHDAETLIEQAEIAAKSLSQVEGENACCHYHPDMSFELKNQILLKGDLQKSLERNEFELHYQPRLALESEKITGFEALLRWNHPERGMLFPLEFIPIIKEMSEFIIFVEDWVLKTACHQLKTWLNMDLPVKNIAVNLSARQLKHPDLVSNIEKIILDAGIQPDYLELEITETILTENLETVTFNLKQLSGMGVKLSLNNFGTGYTPLHYLNSFPLDNLKIHRTFVKDISTEKNATIAKGIVSLAKVFNLKTIAAGVETESQKRILRAIGCDFIQGYLLSKPLSAEEATQLFSPL